ncbi:nitroreductase family protein [Desulfovibrio ferrophilus]|uniref:Nitroreductase n=1 Tax=Desulfovibrio ferrophilus TaxID=241368 RepID=A0A2Z6AUZ1_9BACT|nr:nitroreductase family protein [Desulfovibrio ferrophilus]BBD07062.1 nitroreductase [Desulfovibrio ferrophilus]
MHVKTASTDYPVLNTIRDRWSPRAFANRPVAREDLLSILEAARWAPSCYNDQPWFFILAEKSAQELYEKMFNCLLPGNQKWATSAPVLMLSVARTSFAQSGKPNQHALHDVGQAVAQLSIQAVSVGIFVHQMAGFNKDKARTAFSIPDEFDPVAAIALGYPGDPIHLPEDLKTMESAPRQRRTLSEFVFNGTFGTTTDILP